MKKLIIGLSLLVLSQLTHAAEYLPVSTINYIWTYKTYAVIRVSEAGTNQYNCTHARSPDHIHLKFDDTGGREMYSAAVAAFMSDTKVSFAINRCEVGWSNKTMPSAYRIDLSK